MQVWSVRWRGIAWSLRPFAFLLKHVAITTTSRAATSYKSKAVSDRARRRDQPSLRPLVRGSGRTRDDRDMSRSPAVITLALLGGLLSHSRTSNEYDG